MIPVMWRDWDARESWDQQILLDLTAGERYVHYAMHWASAGYQRGAVCIIPGQHYVNAADQLSERIASLPWALTIICSDEEALFPVELLPRDDTHKVWGQYHARPEFDRVIPIGCPPGTVETLARITDTGMGDVYFAGQDTHERRHELIGVLREMQRQPDKYGNVVALGTTGFRAGFSQESYLAGMKDTRIAPCPSGPHSLDSFRLYEALAAGALPVIETHTPHGDERDFWSALDETCPIPTVDSWSELPALVELYADPEEWRLMRDAVHLWWRCYREGLSARFVTTVQTLKAAAE